MPWAKLDSTAFGLPLLYAAVGPTEVNNTPDAAPEELFRRELV